jgi:polyribonucleotide nucleotidyltransferase
VVSAKSPKEGIDFLPLTVNYQEKAFAAGRIPGGYFKREGRPTERETLISRLIDRPIRPLFVEGYRCDTQVIVTVLSHDLENDPDILAMAAVSAALTLSGVPFQGPVGAARVGYINGEYVLNTPIDKMPESVRDLVVAGTSDAVLMVESEAKELSEEVMLGAVMFGHRSFQAVINGIIRLAEKAAKDPRDFTPPDHSALYARIKAFAEADLRAAYGEKQKQVRYGKIDAVKKRVMAEFTGEGKPDPALRVSGQFKELEAAIVRNDILDTGRRIDGRDTKTVRPIVSEVGVLPRTHGSSLFTRGETQALVPARTSNMLTRLRGRSSSTSCCTITSPRTRSVRPAAWAALAVARSAMASLRGGPSIRCCRPRKASPTRSALSRRSLNRMDLLRWPRYAAPRCR